MSVRAPIEYSSATALRGPLLIVEGVDGVGWDELVEIRLDSGDVRHGVVLEVDRDLAVIEVFEGTAGMGLERLRVSFAGTPLQISVGESWLGRVCDGRGQPLDGGPPILGGALRDVGGSPINPVAREAPSDPIITGIAAIDGLATLVRGQKLPIFSLAGLPHLELAAQIAAQARTGDEAFATVFAAVGLTKADAETVRETLEERAAGGELLLLLNTADDPLVERIVTPRIALTVAEHLAFDLGRHVLVVLADLTSYCEALREISAARGEVPSRRGYPGYLYSDLASIYERAGRLHGRPGSLTQLPVLTMPAGDITHPIPDLTGYITEGQLVLSQELALRNVYPPFDALASLSRLMRRGAGPGRTRGDHLEVAAQLYALAAEARQVADLADVVGEGALSFRERRYLEFATEFESHFLSQRQTEARSLEETLERAWAVASLFPREELSMISRAVLDAHYPSEGSDANAAG